MNISKQFDECPVCALKKWIMEVLHLEELPPKTKELFFEQMGNELKLRGILKPETEVCLDMKSGVVGNKEMINRLPIGSELPGFKYTTDICMKCGTIRAVKIESHNVKKEPELIIPEIRGISRN